MHCKKKYRKGGITPDKDTDPKKRDYLGQAEKSKERNKRRRKVVKELGSGKAKTKAENDNSGGSNVWLGMNIPSQYSGHMQSSVHDGYIKSSDGGKSDFKPSYKSSGKDLDELMKESAEYTDKILRGKGGGSKEYAQMARDIVYDREVMRAAIDADRELLNSGKISSEEFKKRKEKHIAKNKALRKESRDTYKFQKSEQDFTMYRKGGITPNNDTDPKKERDYEAMADRSSQRSKERIKKTKELGSGKFKKAGKSDGGVGAYCAKVGGGQKCAEGTKKMKAQGKRSGTSYKSSGKDLSDAMKESAKKTERILRGKGGGSEAYQKASRDITYDREAMREAVAKDRELLNSGEISNEEFKKRKAAHIAKNKESRKKTSEQHKEDAAAQRASRDSDDSSLSTGRSRGRRGFRVKRGTDPEQLVKLKAKKPKLYKNGGTTPKVSSYQQGGYIGDSKKSIMKDLKRMREEIEKGKEPSRKRKNKRQLKAIESAYDARKRKFIKDASPSVLKYSTKPPLETDFSTYLPDYLDPEINPKIKTLGDQYRKSEAMKKKARTILKKKK